METETVFKKQKEAVPHFHLYSAFSLAAKLSIFDKNVSTFWAEGDFFWPDHLVLFSLAIGKWKKYRSWECTLKEGATRSHALKKEGGRKL